MVIPIEAIVMNTILVYICYPLTSMLRVNVISFYHKERVKLLEHIMLAIYTKDTRLTSMWAGGS